MMTPQEVSEHAFARASFGGYNMSMVDEFLDALTADYSALYNENAVLKSKMKVLADKVEEYRTTEDAMRKALMTAQRMADALVQEAEQQKADILKEAERAAKDKVSNIRQDAATEEYRLAAAQSATAAYVAKVRQLHEQELKYLDELSQLTPPAPSDQPTVEETAQEIENNVQRLISAQEEKEQAEPAPAAVTEATTEFRVVSREAQAEPQDEDMERTAVRRIKDFGKLEFGQNFEIS